MQTPSELAEIRMRLSAEYGKHADDLADILERKALAWKGLREHAKSDKQAEMAWNETEDGIAEMRLKLKLKSLEKKMSAIKTHLEVLQGEARNLY